MVHGCSAMISRFQICDLPDGCEGMLNYLVVKWLRRHGTEELLSEFHQNMIESQLLKHKLVGFRQGMQIHCLPVVSTSCISCITCGLFLRSHLWLSRFSPQKLILANCNSNPPCQWREVPRARDSSHRSTLRSTGRRRRRPLQLDLHKLWRASNHPHSS